LREQNLKAMDIGFRLGRNKPNRITVHKQGKVTD
jgi:hypothetical protein